MTEPRKLLERAAELAADYVESLPTRPVQAAASYHDMVVAFSEPLPEHGRDPAEVLEHIAATAEPGLVAMSSGRYFGFVVGGSVPAALAADVLVTGYDQNNGLTFGTPATAAIEKVAGGWIKDVLHLPATASVGFVTGGLMANFTGLMAGRHHVLAAAGWDVEALGLNGAPPVRVIASAERHATIDMALRYLGLGSGIVQEIETDDQSRIVLDSLRELLSAGSGPTLVCLAAGNVNTGAFDDLGRAIDLAHEFGAWVHIDGAFGLWAAATRTHRHLVEGYARADSWATDAHKWLNVPYDCGIAIVAHEESHRVPLGAKASYLIREGEDADPFELVPEFSRRARGVPVYAALSSLGRDGVADMIERGCVHAAQFAEQLGALDGVEILNDVVLNQVLVRFADDDAITNKVVAGVLADGTAYMTPSVWKGKAVMRISVANWQTTDADVAASVAAVERVFRATMAS
jgi:glutamate/tyrosine decarboxylase-like PLP-dependent enzyme